MRTPDQAITAQRARVATLADESGCTSVEQFSKYAERDLVEINALRAKAGHWASRK